MGRSKLILYLLLSIVPCLVRADVFRSETLGAGKFSLGADPQITFEGNTDATLFLHGGFGLGGGYGVHFKMGFGESPVNDDPVYVGGMFDIPLLRDGRGYPGIYLSLGVSSLGTFSIDNHLILHNDFGKVILYGGLDDHLTIVDQAGNTDVHFPMDLVFGAEFKYVRPMHFLFEGGINLHDYTSSVSFGIKFYFL